MRKSAAIAILLLFFSLYSSSQVTDSLKKLLSIEKNDTTRCNILSAIVENEADDAVWPAYNDQMKLICENFLKTCKPNDPLKKFYLKRLSDALNNIGYLARIEGKTEEALKYFRSSLKMSEDINDKNGMASTLNNIGAIYKDQGDVTRALEYYKQSLRISEELNDKTKMASFLNNIGIIYRNLGDVPLALDYFHKGLRLKEEMDDKSGIAAALNNIGVVYDSQGDMMRALEYHEKSLKISEAINDKAGIGGSLNNIGLIYRNEHALQKALNYYKKGLNAFEEINDKIGISNTLNNIGTVYHDLGNFSLALAYYNKSLKIREELEEKKGTTVSLNHIAVVMLKMGDSNSAQKTGERGLQLARELGFPELISDASNTLSKIYSEKGMWEQAYKMHVLHKHMADSFNNESSKKASIQKAFQYKYEKKAAADSVKTVEERKVRTAEVKQEKTQRIALYGGLILVVAFSLFIFNRFRISQRQKQIIEKQKRAVDDAYDKLHEKNKEIMDSIYYARRIQSSLLTNENYIGKEIKRLLKDTNVGEK